MVWAVFALVTLVGLGLRLARPLTVPIWYDEAATWSASTASWWQLLTWQHHFEHPPLSFALVKGLTWLLGTDAPWALRLPSFVAGVLCVPAAFLAGRTLVCQRPLVGGAVFATLVAGSSLQIGQSAQARMYTLLTLATLLTLTALAKWHPTPRREEETSFPTSSTSKSLFVYGALTGVALGAAILTHALGLLLLGALLVAVCAVAVIRRGQSGRRIAAAGGIALLVAAAMSVPGIAKHAIGTGDGQEVVAKDIDAFNEQPATSPGGQAWRVLKTTLFDLFPKNGTVGLLLVGLGLVGVMRLARRQSIAGGTLLGLLGASIVILPIALMWHHTFSTRYLILTELAVFAGVAALAAELRTRAARGAIIVFAIGVAIWGGTKAAFDKPDLEHGTGSLLATHADAVADGDLFVCHRPLTRRLALYYGLSPTTLDDAPPPAVAAKRTVWVFTGHLETNGDPNWREARRTAEYVADTAAAAGHGLSREATWELLRTRYATLWRVNSEGVEAWSGRGATVEPLTVESLEVPAAR